jgi:hypothetical protein
LKEVLMTETERALTDIAAVTDHRLVPPLTGAGDDGEAEEAELIETAADLESLDEAIAGTEK